MSRDFSFKVNHPGMWEGACDNLRDFLYLFNDEIYDAWVVDQRIDEESKRKGDLLRYWNKIMIARLL